MKTRAARDAAVLLLAVLQGAFASGCVAYKQFNTEPEQYLRRLPRPEGSEVSIDLAIIEFDEFGMLWDQEQLDAALRLIRERNASSDNGVMLSVYVHGWQNNADPKQTNNDLARFHSDLGDLADELEQEDGLPTDVIGVYIGWRGATTSLPLLKNLTFWDRRRGGERVASYRMRETLIELTDATKVRPESKVFVRGHSMGGMIVGLALGPGIETMLLASREQGFRSPIDGVYLLNPALDAMSTFQLVDFMKRRGVVGELRDPETGRVEPMRGPVIAAITSEADWITRVAYPTGQWLDRRRVDKREFREGAWPSQTTMSMRATGHLPFLASHRAFVEAGEVVIEPIEGAWNDTPYWIVTVTEEIGRDHGDIHNPYFRDILYQLSDPEKLYDTKVQTWLKTTE
ncbi:MAG: hypothetical protein AAF108_03445 [Planctomycetota bacterium]